MQSILHSFVICTAGHIDHGKTALIEALTGINCDRLPEEKRREMTIELGFAHMALDDGRVISIVDVPGHEKFIRHMVSGAAGVDAAMMVIAADDGVMPQTREHLAIMQLLGIRDGITIITKIDRAEVTSRLLDDVKALTRNTFLEGRPIVPVSSMTGENLDTLRKELQALAARVTPRDTAGDLFMPIDRVFSVAGFGTVATGTIYHGSVSAGDTVEIMPSGIAGRVRGIQIHSQSVMTAQAGHRAAVNIAGVSAGDISRGQVICTPGAFRPFKRINAAIKTDRPLKHMQRVHIHAGTSEILARVMVREGRARLILEEPAMFMDGQKFIMRFYSPLITIGGGHVIYPEPPKPKEEATPTSQHDNIPDNIFAEHKDTLRKICLSRKWRLPMVDELTLPDAVIRAMENSGELALLPEGFVLMKELEDELKNILRGIDGIITLSDIRDILHTSRKYIVPVLEHFDRKGITRREGAGRVVQL